jgi:hypothetical protein
MFSYSEGYFSDQMHSNDVNLQPEYQRGNVSLSERTWH